MQQHVFGPYQKQTSSQLVHFLRSNTKSKNVVEVSYEWSEYFQKPSDHCQPDTAATAPPNGGTNHHSREAEMEELGETLALRKQVFSEMDTHYPVFTVKRVESGGSLTYTCTIATQTELWDVGDIFTEDRHTAPQGLSASGQEDLLQISCTKDHVTPRHLQTEEVSSRLKVSTDLLSFPKCSASSSINLLRSPEPNHLNIPESGRTSIPKFQVRKFEETAVVVSHMISPGCFYIQHAEASIQLQALHTNCSSSLQDSRSLAELQRIPDIGSYVMSWFPSQEMWCRAQVIKICGMCEESSPADCHRAPSSIQVEVRRLDYGDTSCVSLWDIKELHPDMTSLPLQAAQVALAHVAPVEGSAWSQVAVAWFRDMVENRTLFARLYNQGEGEDAKVLVELFMERGKIGAMRRGASLSLRLAQNGHAQHDKLRNIGIKRSSAQEQSRKQEAVWEKYLISCYTQQHKQLLWN